MICGKDVNPAAPVGIGEHQVGQRECRLAEKLRATLILQNQKLPLDRPDRGAGHIAIAQGQVFRVLAAPDQKRLKVRKIEKRPALFIGDAERHVQDALLNFGKLQQAAEQQRPHLGDRGADRVALGAEQVPDGHRKGRICQVEPDRLGAFHEGVVELEIAAARNAKPRKIALHICQENRNAGLGKPLCKDLQGHRLARASRARDKAVAVGIIQEKGLRLAVALTAAANKNRAAHPDSFPSHPCTVPTQDTFLTPLR